MPIHTDDIELQYYVSAIIAAMEDHIEQENYCDPCLTGTLVKTLMYRAVCLAVFDSKTVQEMIDELTVLRDQATDVRQRFVLEQCDTKVSM